MFCVDETGGGGAVVAGALVVVGVVVVVVVVGDWSLLVLHAVAAPAAMSAAAPAAAAMRLAVKLDPIHCVLSFERSPLGATITRRRGCAWRIPLKICCDVG